MKLPKYSTRAGSCFGRHLAIEPLETRRMLAADLLNLANAFVDGAAEENSLVNAAAVPAITDGRLAYHSYTDYGIDGELHVWDFALGAPYTRAEQTVNARVRYVMNPQFSGDGRYLVMMGVDRQLPKAWPNLDIFAYDFQTDTINNLSEALITVGLVPRLQDRIDEDPSFNPTTLTVAFKRRDSANGQSDLWSIQLNANLAPTTLTQLTNTPNVEESGPKFSPDGQTIVCWVNGGTFAWIGTLAATGGAITVLADNAGIQDYYPSYWDSTRVLYTSWDNASSRDDDIRLRDLVGGTDVFAAGSFHSAGEDSDAFRISSTLVGFSSTTGSADGKWRIRYGDPLTGQTQVLPFHTTNKHDLGGTYTLYRVGYAAALPGDYSSSGTVDAADYIIWRNTLGSTATNYSGADGNGNGIIDQGDHTVWRSNFANSTSSSTSRALPPGPSANSSATPAAATTTRLASSLQTSRKPINIGPVTLGSMDTRRALIAALGAVGDDDRAPRTATFHHSRNRQNDASLSVAVAETAFDEWPFARL